MPVPARNLSADPALIIWSERLFKTETAVIGASEISVLQVFEKKLQEMQNRCAFSERACFLFRGKKMHPFFPFKYNREKNGKNHV